MAVFDNENEFIWRSRVYYEDTDVGGIVYHANYLKYMERARTEWLRSFGIEQNELIKSNIGLVVTKMDIRYLGAAKLDDLLTVQSQLNELKKASVLFEQNIFNADNKLLISAHVRVACIDLEKMKPKAMPDSILGELSRVI